MKIEITPHQALTICNIINLFDLENKQGTVLKEIQETITEQIAKKCSMEEIEECFAQREVNVLLGKEPG